MKNKLAVQLFTLRDHTKTTADFAQALERVADIGYRAVQLSAVGCMNGENPEVEAADARRMLDDNGLKCIATHRPLDALINHTDAEIEFHQTLGCDYVAIGGINGYEQTLEGYRQFLNDIRPAVEKLKKAGIRFGHHNHSKEFVKTSDHRWLEDVLIEEGGEDLMLELDLYWVEHAGLNCVRLLERSCGRVPVIHLKDKEVVPGEGPVMAPIGEGNMDWEHIIPACETAGVDWYAVEQDRCRRDPFDCLRSSFDYLSKF
ncbi:MAG: sugar phosphate isomerase/epimerase [Lentisphaeria bacterium]